MARELYQRRVLAGLCPKCGKPSAEGRTTCEFHLKEGRERRAKLVAKRKEEHKCITCGADVEEEERTRCNRCMAEKARQQREERKMLDSLGLCRLCKKEPVFLGDKLCAECAEKNRKSSAEKRARMTEEQRAAVKEQKKRHRRELIEKGICRCGKKAREGRTLCTECLIIANERRRKRYVPHPKDPSLCSTCGKKPVFDKYKVCESCYKNLIKTRSMQKVDMFRVENDIHFAKMRYNAANSAVRASKTV